MNISIVDMKYSKKEQKFMYIQALKICRDKHKWDLDDELVREHHH